MDNRKRKTKNNLTKERFYQMPKWLFNPEFNELSNNSKVLYSLLADRYELSLSNGWINENDEIFFIFTRNEIANIMNCSIRSAISYMKELKQYKLIDVENNGLNKASYIYLLEIDIASIENKGRANIAFQEVKKTALQEMQILHCNDTNVNNTECKETKDIKKDIKSSFEKDSKQLDNSSFYKNVSAFLKDAEKYCNKEDKYNNVYEILEKFYMLFKSKKKFNHYKLNGEQWISIVKGALLLDENVETWNAVEESIIYYLNSTRENNYHSMQDFFNNNTLRFVLSKLGLIEDMTEIFDSSGEFRKD